MTPQKTMGITSEGSMFMVLQSLRVRMDRPEQASGKPPTMDS